MNVRIPAAVAAALIALSPLYAPAQSTPAAHIAAVQMQALSDFLAASPEVATFLGDYSRDGDWSDPTPAGLAHFKAMLASYEQKINSIEMTSATLQDLNDIRLMRAFLVGQRRAIADQEAGKDPSAAPLTVLGAVFTMILHKDEQDSNVWWDHMISRMEKAPAMDGRAAAADHASRTAAGRGRAQAARDGAGPLLLRADADVGAAARRSAGALRQGARRARRVYDGVDQVDERQRPELADQLRDGRGRVQRDVARRAAAALRCRSDRCHRAEDARRRDRRRTQDQGRGAGPRASTFPTRCRRRSMAAA